MTTSPSTVTGQTVTFDALDGVALEGSLFQPGTPPRAALLVSSGTGIPRRFYARFAQAAAERGFVALTYDYRGVGGSAPDALRGYDARYRDVGQQDIAGAAAWLGDRYPDLPLLYVGHSAGGQQLGLAPNVSRIAAAVFVAVSTGYWRGMPLAQRYLTLGLFRAYIPLASRLYGYAPAKKIKWGENLPTGMAREWGAWCMEPEYMAAYFDEGGRLPTPDGAPFGPVHYGEAVCPVLAYAFTDDPIATRENVPPMLGMYANAEVETRWVAPGDLGVLEIGHIGFFRPNVGGALWDDVFNWLMAQAPTRRAV